MSRITLLIQFENLKALCTIIGSDPLSKENRPTNVVPSLVQKVWTYSINLKIWKSIVFLYAPIRRVHDDKHLLSN